MPGGEKACLAMTLRFQERPFPGTYIELLRNYILPKRFLGYGDDKINEIVPHVVTSPLQSTNDLPLVAKPWLGDAYD